MKPLHELDALCAEKVAGWRDVMPAGYVDPESGTTYYTPTGGTFHNPFRRQMPSYTTDPAAVLGLLEKEHCVSCGRCYQKGPNGMVDAALPLIWYVDIGETDEDAGKTPHTGMAPTFALAATLALLKAHGCEVGE